MRTLQEIQPGQTLGRYEFLVPIAEGGMASVWAARLKGTRGFSKTVALKTMLPSVSDDPQFEQMFLDEAQIVSRIRHPNVVEIMDLGEEDEVLYLVMEWVDGEPLSNLRRAAAKAGGIPRNIAVRIVGDACAGLHAAHELKEESGQLVGLVHRDVSPQNLLVTFDGVVKIVDFGVAKAAGRSSGQTMAGQVKGKPPYMSPEQALGEAVDRRTDVFALGIILYQLTTGKHPFRGESDLVTLQNIVSDKPIVTPRAYDKAYPRLLEAVVMKALDRRRESRYQSCAEFEAAIDDVFSKEMPRARAEDVGKFMREMLGPHGEKRRKALLDSIRLADERAAGRMSYPEPGSGPRALPSSTLTPASGLTPAIEFSSSPGTDPNALPVTPFGATIPAPLESRSVGGAVLAVLFAGLAGAAVVVALHGRTAEPSQEEPSPPHVAAAGLAAPVVTPPPAVAAPEIVAQEPVPASSAGDKPRGARPKGASHPAHVAAPVAPASAKKAEAPKPPQTAKPTAKGGFMPPPMSDPGF
ncbi:MAG TPA: protein kinase [Polyangiaceae bacterium]